MDKEIKSTEEAILLRLGQMVKENVELEQRVHQLTDDYNEVVRQMREQEKRKSEDPATHNLDQQSQMIDHCNKLEVENAQLEEYANILDSFIKDKELYMPKGIKCPSSKGNPAVASSSCLECASCIRVLEGFGVVCGNVLYEAKVRPATSCPPDQSNS